MLRLVTGAASTRPSAVETDPDARALGGEPRLFAPCAQVNERDRSTY